MGVFNADQNGTYMLEECPSCPFGSGSSGVTQEGLFHPIKFNCQSINTDLLERCACVGPKSPKLQQAVHDIHSQEHKGRGVWTQTLSGGGFDPSWVD